MRCVRMRVGKLTNAELDEIVFGRLKLKNPEVLFGAGLAEDCAAVKTDQTVLVTTDPITAATFDVGRLSVDVSANDIASSGANRLRVCSPSSSRRTRSFRPLKT